MELSAPDYWLARMVVLRGIGAVYLVAFLVAHNQFRALLGSRGLLPVPRFLERVSVREAPSIFHLHYSDRFLGGVTWTGVVLATAVVLGLPERGPLWMSVLIWLVLWALYLSIVNVGRIFYSFGWESLLLEAGFLAAFLGTSRVAPPLPMIWLLRWLVFRLEFGAGLIKMRGDRCWRDLTCLHHHHETQPMPGPLSRWFHLLPGRVHKVEVLANHVTQLVVPFGLFAPQPVAGIAGVAIVVTQVWLVLSGNFSWLNVLTIVLAASAFSNDALARWVPVSPPVTFDATPLWFTAVVAALTVLVVGLSWWPVRNMVSRRQVMNSSFNRLHLVNAYGAFGSVTRVRREIVIEGTDEAEPGPGTAWREYEFKGKPGDVRRRPPQIAPYHLRLDWLMWFAALSPGYAEPWFVPFLAKLLDNDPPTLRLLRSNPFPDRPPTYVRARVYRYRFTTRRERRETGAWWARELIGEYLPPVARRPASSAGRNTAGPDLA